MSLFSRYQLKERIAQGGMGEVFRATDVGYGGMARTVEVKRIAPQYAREPEFLKTFRNEAKLSFLLGHANVVRVLDVGEHEESLFIVLEWVHGADLGAILAYLREEGTPAMPTRLALTIAAEMARGLDYAHRLVGPEGQPLGLVHRDVSPANVLLSVEGEVKISDFGIARSKLQQSASLPGQLKGKLFYMAPEQASGEPLDRRADVFSLGAVLYEMLCGMNPFLARGTDADLLDRVRRGDYPPPTEFVKDLDHELSELVLRAMAPERDRRFATCRELRAALLDHAIRHGHGLSTEDLGDFVRALVERHSKTRQPTAAPTVLARRPTTPASPPPAPPIPEVDADAGLATGATRPMARAELAAALFTEPARPAERPVVRPDRPDDDHDDRDDEAIVSTANYRRPPSVDSPDEPVAAAGQPPAAVAPGAPGPSPRALAAAALTLVLISIVGALGARWLRRTMTTQPIATAPSEPSLPAPSSPPVAEPEAARPFPPGKALLSIESDQAAEVYLDGKLVGDAPLVDFVVGPGSHRVKVRGTGPGLFAVPPESTLTLRAGERKRVTIPVKAWKSE